MKMNKKDFIKAKVHAYITPGEALKLLREQQGLTQAELASITRISQIFPH